MTKTDSFDVTILLDRSGSMSSVKTDMEGALASFVSAQAALPGECKLSLYTFDTEIACPFSAVDIRSAPAVKLEPRGCTALLDSLAHVIDETGKRLAAMPEADRPGRVVVTVITDGQENASRRETFDKVRERVERQTKDFKWEFLFLGAGLDSFAQGAQLGVANAVNYTSSPVGVRSVMDSYTKSLSMSRSTGDALCMTQDQTVPNS